MAMESPASPGASNAPHGEELAVNQPRYSLLDSIKHQVACDHVSRVLFAFQVADDEAQSTVQQSLTSWIEAREEADKVTGADRVTGIMFGLGQYCVSIIEGPTPALCKALTHVSDLSTQVKDEKKPFAQNLTVLYLVELRGIRVYPAFIYVHHPSKTSNSPFDDSAAERTFTLYRDLLKVGAVILDGLNFPEDPADHPQLPMSQLASDAAARAKDKAELLPTHDVLESLLSGGSGVAYASFHETFIAHSHLELESTKLWPIPPPLSY